MTATLCGLASPIKTASSYQSSIWDNIDDIAEVLNVCPEVTGIDKYNGGRKIPLDYGTEDKDTMETLFMTGVPEVDPFRNANTGVLPIKGTFEKRITQLATATAYWAADKAVLEKNPQAGVQLMLQRANATMKSHVAAIFLAASRTTVNISQNASGNPVIVGGTAIAVHNALERTKMEADARRWKLSDFAKYKGYIVFVWLVILTLIVLYLSFRQAPSLNPATGRTAELSTWTAQQAKLIPSAYRQEVKAIFREAYQETVQKIKSGQIATTADARLQVSQLIQAKIRTLNRNKPETEELIKAMTPLSEAIGDRLAGSDDTLESVQKQFSNIASGLK